jgi:hypothetical protein
MRLDYSMRKKVLGGEKKQIWFMDQYRNPLRGHLYGSRCAQMVP